MWLMKVRKREREREREREVVPVGVQVTEDSNGLLLEARDDHPGSGFPWGAVTRRRRRRRRRRILDG
jgi:hypothetical protein